MLRRGSPSTAPIAGRHVVPEIGEMVHDRVLDNRIGGGEKAARHRQLRPEPEVEDA